MTMVQRGHLPPPEPGAPGIFALGERERLLQVVTGAGFVEPRIEELAFEWRYSSEDLWDTLTRISGSLAIAISELPAEEQQATRAQIEERMAQFRQNGEMVVPAAAWGVVA
jgi:hypothetical protein